MGSIQHSWSQTVQTMTVGGWREQENQGDEGRVRPRTITDEWLHPGLCSHP